MKLSNDFFLVPSKGKLLLWDYRRHKQYQLDKLHVERLLEHAMVGQSSSSRLADDSTPIDHKFLEAGILMKGASPTCDDTSNWGWDLLSRIYHLGTQDVPTSSSGLATTVYASYYKSATKDVVRRIQEIDRDSLQRFTGARHVLPPADKAALEVSLRAAFDSRRTVRSFIPCILGLQQISTILHLAAGQSTPREGRKACFVEARNYFPTAGNLHSSNAWLIAYRIEGIPAGVYRYLPEKHEIVFVAPAPVEDDLPLVLHGQPFLKGASASVILSTSFQKLQAKYSHSRAYRMGLIELGALIQTVQLGCSALGLSTWISGAMKDSFFNRLLDLDNHSESAMFFMSIGRSNGEALPQEFYS